MSNNTHIGTGKIRLGNRADHSGGTMSVSHDSSRFNNPPPYQTRNTSYTQYFTAAAIALSVASAGFAGHQFLVEPYLAESKIRDINIAEKSKLADKGDDLIASARLDEKGRLTKNGDFYIQVGIYKLGKVKIFVTEGPYAGTQVSIYPVDPNPKDSFQGGEVVFAKVGATGTKSGQIDTFRILSGNDVKVSRFPMAPSTERKSPTVIVPDYEDIILRAQAKNVTGDMPTIFALNADPKDMTRFSIRLWNNDLYAINLAKQQFFVQSTYLTDPNWKVGNIQKRSTAYNDPAASIK